MSFGLWTHSSGRIWHRVIEWPIPLSLFPWSPTVSGKSSVRARHLTSFWLSTTQTSRRSFSALSRPIASMKISFFWTQNLEGCPAISPRQSWTRRFTALPNLTTWGNWRNALKLSIRFWPRTLRQNLINRPIWRGSDWHMWTSWPRLRSRQSCSCTKPTYLLTALICSAGRTN